MAAVMDRPARPCTVRLPGCRPDEAAYVAHSNGMDLFACGPCMNELERLKSPLEFAPLDDVV